MSVPEREARTVIGSLEISLDALRANAAALRALVAPVRAAFVVKSDAYGHGLVQTARAVEPLAAYLCVYALDEAIALRDAGINSPVLVMGPVPANDLEEAFARNVEIALWDSHGYLRALANVAAQRHGRFGVHVKIDTGVARFGIDIGSAPDAIEDYARMPEIELRGIFSHLAAAEELDSPFTQTQLARFSTVSEAVTPFLEPRGVRPIRHIAASAAAMLWPQTRLDMVRIGIALYGLWPSDQTRVAMNGAALELQPALSFTSTLAAVRDVESGAPIGYGCTFHAPRGMRIGAVPLGYADGIPRALSNRGAFLVHGARCPIVGRVCMNVTLIDLTAAPHAKPGDRVTLIGRDGEQSVTADEWALWADTINYEIVARLPGHLPRVY